MLPAIVTATVQATILSFASCMVAKYLSSSTPPVLALVAFAILSTPPNFLWQQYIERKFPGYYTRKIEVDDYGKGVKVETKLNIRNTIAKFVLDQTVAALVNVMTFLGGVRLLNGESVDVCWQAVKEVCYILIAWISHIDTISDQNAA